MAASIPYDPQREEQVLHHALCLYRRSPANRLLIEALTEALEDQRSEELTLLRQAFSPDRLRSISNR